MLKFTHVHIGVCVVNDQSQDTTVVRQKFAVYTRVPKATTRKAIR